MSLDIRHNEYWPKGRVTVFLCNAEGCSCYFGTREDGTPQLRDVYEDIQYVCINTEDWDATVKWLKEEIAWVRSTVTGRIRVT